MLKKTRYTALVFVIFLTCNQLVSQGFRFQERVDSLNNILVSTQVDTTRVNTLLNLVNIYYTTNPDTAIILCEQAQILSEKSNYNLGKSESYGWLGYLFTAKGDIAKAQEYNFKSLELIEKSDDKESLATLYTNIGTIFSRQGSISEALRYYHLGLKIQEETEDVGGVAHTLNSIGMIYKYQNDIPLALEYYNRSLKMWEEVGDNGGIGLTLNNIGVIYFENYEYDLAMEYYEKSLVKRKEAGAKSSIANSLGNIGTIYESRKEYGLALKYYNQAHSLQEEIGNKDGQCQSLFNIAVLHFTMGNMAKARQVATESFELATELGYPYRIQKAANLLSNIYLKEKNYKIGWEMYRLHIEMRDSILNEETQKDYIKQEIQYEYDRKVLTDSLEFLKMKEIQDLELNKQEAIIKRDQAIIKRDQTEKYAMIGVLFLMLISIGVTVMGYLRKKKDNKLINLQKNAVEHQKQEIEVQHIKLEETHKEIADSINYAKRIQQAILPSMKQTKELLPNSFILYKPKDIVAGDFYWMENVPNVISNVPTAVGMKQSVNKEQMASNSLNQSNDVVLFAAADCTGHGVPGAMVSVVCNNALNRSVREYGLTEPGKILDKSREIVIQEFEKSEEEVKDGMDIALCSLEFVSSSLSVPRPLLNGGKSEEEQGTHFDSAQYDGKQRTVAKLQYAGAHNPLWIIRNGEVLETKANKQPIGKFDKQIPYTTHTFELQQGDVIYLFSDGYVDQFGGGRGKKFKTKAFRELLLSIQSKSMDSQKKLIDEAFETWRGDLEQIDDVCVIGVKI